MLAREVMWSAEQVAGLSSGAASPRGSSITYLLPKWCPVRNSVAKCWC